MVVAGPTEEAGSEDDTALGCGLPAGVSMGNPFGVGALIASAAARASVSAASRLACIDGEIFFPSMDVINPQNARRRGRRADSGRKRADWRGGGRRAV